MPKGVLFWVLMILWLIFGIWSSWPSYYVVGGNVLLWVVIGLLGWQVFGKPVQ
jgi:hypothetical protein